MAVNTPDSVTPADDLFRVMVSEPMGDKVNPGLDAFSRAIHAAYDNLLTVALSLAGPGQTEADARAAVTRLLKSQANDEITGAEAGHAL